MNRWIITSLVVACFAGCRPESKTLMVFAAASTQDAVRQIAQAYDKTHDLEIEINSASSSTLARQIEMGMPADVYISANAQWMHYLTEKGLLQADSRCVLLSNQLVLIARRDAPLEPGNIDDLLKASSGPLALGDPTHVPAGQYARQALNCHGGFDAYQNRILPGQDVRAALAYVERGEAPLGIVYATDARLSDRVKVLGTFAAASHDPITYVAAVVKDAPPAARAFLTYLRGSEAQTIFKDYGFLPGSN